MNKLNFGLFLIFILYGLSSCSKFLDKLPDNRTVISTPEQVTMLLASAYPHATYMLFSEAMTDNAEDKGNSAQGVDPTAFQTNIYAYKYEDPLTNVGTDLPTTYWDSCYHAIAVANLALTYCHGNDSALYAAQKGEALLCRAYAHFMLVTLFAKTFDSSTSQNDPGVPYMTEVSTQVFNTYDRKTVAYDYEMIQKDIEEGLPLIDDNVYGDAPRFHFNTNAAHAFASRFYLFKKDYNKVISNANIVLGTGSPVNMLRNTTGVYNLLQFAQIGMQYVSSAEPANLLLQEVESEASSYAYLRYAIGENWVRNYYSRTNVSGGYFSFNLYGASPQYYNTPKFYRNVIPLLSSEEVLFNRAEAYLKKGDFASTLKDLNYWASVNIVVSRSTNKTYNSNLDVTVSKAQNFYNQSADSAVLNTILDYKRVAYLEEGLRWLDILRLKIPVTHTTYETGGGETITLTSDDKRRLLQLPEEAVNEGMALNPR